MSSDGAVWLHRSALESWLWQLPAPQFKVAMTILLKANWKPGTGYSGGEPVYIERGAFLTSFEKLAAATKTESPKTVRTTLKNLEKFDFAARRAARKGQVVSVTNYDTYQPDPRTGGKVSGKTAARQRQGSGKTAATIEEGKKGRREEERGALAGYGPEARRVYAVYRHRVLAANLSGFRDPGDHPGVERPVYQLLALGVPASNIEHAIECYVAEAELTGNTYALNPETLFSERQVNRAKTAATPDVWVSQIRRMRGGGDDRDTPPARKIKRLA